MSKQGERAQKLRENHNNNISRQHKSKLGENETPLSHIVTEAAKEEELKMGVTGTNRQESTSQLPEVPTTPT